MRSSLLSLLRDYTARGNRAIAAYDDTRGVRSVDVFAELVAQSPEFYEYTPELERYLDTWPAGRPEGARDVLYWSEDRVPRLRPVLTVHHMVLYSPQPDAGLSFVARKQIYASHYFEGAFELLGIVDDVKQPGAFLVIVRRFRLDNLPAGVANVRGRVRSGLVDATRSDLEQYRAAVQGAGR